MVAKKHDFTMTEIKAGAMVFLAAGALLVFLVAVSHYSPEWFKGDTGVYSTGFTNTGGLNLGADVRFGGTKIGRVIELALDPSDQTRILVRFEVNAGVPINAESKASIAQTTLTSSKHLEISTGVPDAPLIEPGAEIPSVEGAGDMFGEVAAAASKAADVLDDVVELLGVEEAKGEEEEGGEEFVSVAALFKDLQGTVDEGTELVKDVRDTVGESREDIGRILDKIQEIETDAQGLVNDVRVATGDVSAVIADSKEDVTAALNRVREILDTVAGATGELESIANSLETAMANAETVTGEAGKLLAENRAEFEGLIRDLRETVGHLKSFSRTIAEQPHALVRGAEPAGRVVK